MNTISSLFKFLGDTLGANPSTLKTTNKTLVGAINSAWELVYPVGSYYETSDASFDPNVSWGGTWSLEESGKVHIGAGTGYTIGATGGSKDAVIVSHYHSVNAVGIGSSGAHTNHTMKGYGDTLGGGSLGWRFGSAGSKVATGIIYGGDHTHTVPAHNTNSTGSAGTNANMQPYIVVNRWHRTA